MAKPIGNARILREKGIHALNVPDSPQAQAKMAAVSASAVLQQQAGIEAIPHVTCKDKNLRALQAEILGAHALGIRNVLLVTGDPPSIGTYPDATAVFDVDAIGLCNVVSLLNRGLDLGRNPVGEPTGFCCGVALNPSAVNLDPELERFRWKLDAGAEFAITQPVFDAQPLRRFMDRALTQYLARLDHLVGEHRALSPREGGPLARAAKRPASTCKVRETLEKAKYPTFFASKIISSTPIEREAVAFRNRVEAC